MPMRSTRCEACDGRAAHRDPGHGLLSAQGRGRQRRDRRPGGRHPAVDRGAHPHHRPSFRRTPRGDIGPGGAGRRTGAGSGGGDRRGDRLPHRVHVHAGLPPATDGVPRPAGSGRPRRGLLRHQRRLHRFRVRPGGRAPAAGRAAGGSCAGRRRRCVLADPRLHGPPYGRADGGRCGRRRARRGRGFSWIPRCGAGQPG